MFVINGRKFARTDTEFVESLFHSGGTCVGYYKRTRHGILLMDHQKNVIGFCKTDSNFTGLVSAYRTDNGRIRYMFGICGSLENLVGFDLVPFGQQSDIIKASINTLED